MNSGSYAAKLEQTNGTHHGSLRVEKHSEWWLPAVEQVVSVDELLMVSPRVYDIALPVI